MMKALIAAMIVGNAVMLSGCHVLKQQSEANPAAVTVLQKTAKPAVSIQSLDQRVTALETRLNTARSARLARLKASVAQ